MSENEVAQSIQEIAKLALAQEKAKQEERRKAIERGEIPVQLPLWDDDQRGAPAAVLRSALFGVIRRGARKAVEGELLAAWKGVEIRFTGFRLDQADLDCWLQVLHLARQYPLGKDVRFTARGFLRAIGRKGDGNSHRWLRRSLERMVACAVGLRFDGGREYVGSLIRDFFHDEASGRYVVNVNPLMRELFDDNFVKLSMERRLLLRPGLARWLQGYVQSHQATQGKPHRISTARILELSGSQMARIRDFRIRLRKAMIELQEQGIVASWRFTEGDALEFSRS